MVDNIVGKQPQTGQDNCVNHQHLGFGVLIIVLTWLGYSRTMAVLPIDASSALLANLVLLFLVAIEPYLFYVLTSMRTRDDRPGRYEWQGGAEH